ncbi:MAG: LysR substrate-binding domain-containing protein [Spirochaeta sp.]|nr:LysR substrate-binding domain-containing protein [Spirochaeta sp.]
MGCGFGCWVAVCDSLVAFRKEEPDVVLNVTVASARALVNLAEAGDLDIIVGNSDTIQTAPWLESHGLFRSEIFFVARHGHPVFNVSVSEQLDLITQYPSTTYHMLEHAHGTRMSGPAVLRVNDYLFLLRHALSTDVYFMVGREMLSFVEELGLRVIGDRSTDYTEYSVAYPREHATVVARSLARAIQEFVVSM